jgi:DNA-binding NarL/FixJ family response regulator
VSAKKSVKPGILIIDSKKLRQAGIMRLFEAWADTVGLAMSAIGPEMPLERCSIDASYEVVILSVGSASVQDRQQEIWIRSVRTLLPEALLVVISDLEEPKEVCAAFEAGAAGFMPTSLDPAVALKALSVIRSGGYFFPRSAVSHIHFTPEMPVEGTAAVDQLNRTDVEPNEPMEDNNRKLTAKQKEVFRFLRRGQTNKLIARQLGISEATVKVHVRGIMRKFGVTNRTQAALSLL